MTYLGMARRLKLCRQMKLVLLKNQWAKEMAPVDSRSRLKIEETLRC